MGWELTVTVKTPANAPTVPMRAYVTGGDPRVTTRAQGRCVRATASRHVVWRAHGSRHTSGAKASRSTHRR